MDRYIVDGEVKRDRIVTDIVRGKIGESEILELDKDPRISNAYFGIGAFGKKDKDLWNDKYLDELSLVSVSESFCKEYLLYLNEVTQYIISNEQKKVKQRRMVGVPVILVVFIFLICAIWFIKIR